MIFERLRFTGSSHMNQKHLIQLLNEEITPFLISDKLTYQHLAEKIGDARATEMSERKEVNLGQIVREHFATTSFHLGFSTYTGTVTAATDWDAPAQIKQVLPGMPGSYEELFHGLKIKDFILDLHHGEHVSHLLKLSRLQRAIGVIYRPETERLSHYFFTHLPYQFDAIVHIDKTQAVQPLK